MNRSFQHKDPLERQPSLSSAIANADQRLILLDKKIEKLNSDLIKLNNQIKKLPDGPLKESVRQKAIKILKYKRTYETDREHLMQQSFIMEKTNLTLQTAQNTQMTLNAMKQIEFENRKIKNDLRDETEIVRDETKGIMDEEDEIQEALSRSYGTPDIDEEELEAELAALNEEVALDGDDSYLDEAMQNIPEVPSHAPVCRKCLNKTPISEASLNKKLVSQSSLNIHPLSPSSPKKHLVSQSSLNNMPVSQSSLNNMPVSHSTPHKILSSEANPNKNPVSPSSSKKHLISQFSLNKMLAPLSSSKKILVSQHPVSQSSPNENPLLQYAQPNSQTTSNKKVYSPKVTSV